MKKLEFRSNAQFEITILKGLLLHNSIPPTLKAVWITRVVECFGGTVLLCSIMQAKVRNIQISGQNEWCGLVDIFMLIFRCLVLSCSTSLVGRTRLRSLTLPRSVSSHHSSVRISCQGQFYWNCLNDRKLEANKIVREDQETNQIRTHDLDMRICRPNQAGRSLVML